MKLAIRMLLATLFVLILALAAFWPCANNNPKDHQQSGNPFRSRYTKEERAVLHRPPAQDIRQQKDEIMGSMMLLSAADAAKFWPIYSDYDVALAKLNDQRIENIEQYAHSYNDLTDEEADRLIQKSVAFQKERAELLAATYEKVKQALGGVTAARFAQIEHQLLLIIDLQIDSSLPIAGQGS